MAISTEDSVGVVAKQVSGSGAPVGSGRVDPPRLPVAATITTTAPHRGGRERPPPAGSRMHDLIDLRHEQAGKDDESAEPTPGRR